MNAQDIEAIVGGHHGDAFGILGPHETKRRWEVRAFLPQAESAAVVVGAVTVPMNKRHDQGFFCATLALPIAEYRLRAKLWDGREVEIDDPYRYGPQISESDLYLHGEGTLNEAYRTLGAHVTDTGVRFAVWAPNAECVTLTGDFNDWDTRRHPMRRRNGGVWEIFLPQLCVGCAYKYHVRSQIGGYQQLKADPYGFYAEAPPKSASVVWKLDNYEWQDGAWMEARAQRDCLKSPISIYEVHAESWLRGLSYSRDGGEVGGIRQDDGLHAPGAAADHGASVFRFVGLPGDWILRAHRAVRHAGRLQVSLSTRATRRASA